ncbi:MAG: pyridoxal-phosphate dependent enzyme [Polyangiaceae bacterium]|nr:pyridoxal-phosphate dependent enzyme [Polyangiaceae bacterium]
MTERLPRIALVHGPTPIVRRPVLDEIIGARIWLKRDDMTGGAEAGNKIRKLEFLLADARAKRAMTVITCGGLQSNHARATAITCAALGLRSVLFLRVPDPARARETPLELTGNVLLDQLVGAEIRFISPDEYRARDGMMEQARVELAELGEAAYVVPEGGSNGLGAMGYVEAMRETKEQIDLGLTADAHGGSVYNAGNAPRFHVVAHACGSGGTAAGVAVGAARFGVARETWAFAVCDDRTYFTKTIARIGIEARGIDPTLPPIAFIEPGSSDVVAPDGAARVIVDDSAKGPAYAIMSDEQKRFIVRIARATGLVLDPVYTGKALFGLAQAIGRGQIPRGADVLFLHTGGLPGLLAQGEDLRGPLSS